MSQTTDTLLLVRPFAFRGNEETQINNYFQSKNGTSKDLQSFALSEFDHFVETLRQHHIRTIIIQDDGQEETPDSIFPNNIISFHGNTAILYPMFAKNRQRERRLNVLGTLEKEGIFFHKMKDYSIFEDNEQYLEGTGAIILDRTNNIAYCSISQRADESLFNLFCEDNKLKPISFHATQLVSEKHLPIYHSNVMMSIGTHFCVICLDSIRNLDERNIVIQSLLDTHKTIIPISEEQMNHFAGNILEVKSTDGTPYIVMSEQAFKILEEEQIKTLTSFGQIIHAPLYTIEKFGGGSARCMIAEVFYE